MNGHDRVLILSSSFTPFYRLFFVPYALLSALVLLVGWASHETSLLLVATALALCATVAFFQFRHLKEIWVDGSIVYASTFRRTITFPASAIVDIRAPRGRPNCAFLYLNQSTAFGDRLLFLPRGFKSLGKNPWVVEVLARARMAPAAEGSAGTPSG